MVLGKGDSLFLGFVKLIYSFTQNRQESSSEETQITEWSILPEEPLAGDVLTIQGKTKPNTVTNISVSFSRPVKVNNGSYEYLFENLPIPKGKNRFDVMSSPVKNLNFIVRMFVDFKRSFESNDGVAKFTDENVPPGSYDIVINGEAMDGEEEVKLEFTALQTIMSDNEGIFYFNYETNALPCGDFTVRAGNAEKKITLREIS
ncbi:MAG: hypothetical protein JW705_02850 [Methanosarcinaceae archaeon]|nr:hypothetical protein [Methanosarcinaceae archaeon]